MTAKVADTLTALFLLFILLLILGLSAWVVKIMADYLGQLVSFSVMLN